MSWFDRRLGAALAAGAAAAVLAGCGGDSTPWHVALDLSRPTPSSTIAPARSDRDGTSAVTPAPTTSTVSPVLRLRAEYRRVASGVVRIATEDCKSSFTGTGFLLSHHLVATVAHAVYGRGVIQVISPLTGRVTTGRVVGLDNRRDLALVHVAGRLPGHVFRFSAVGPGIGDDIGAVGFAQGGPMALTVGRVTDLYRRITVSGARVVYHLRNMVESGAAIRPGDSGGPELSPDGRVVALSESGTDDPSKGGNDGVSSLYAEPEFTRWTAHPKQYAPGACAPKTTLDRALVTLDSYVDDIGAHDYASAYAQFDPANHDASGLAAFTRKVAGTHFRAPGGYAYRIDGQGNSGGAEYVDISYVDKRRATSGHRASCARWTLRFVFATGSGGVQVIHAARPQPGTHGRRAC